MSRLKVKEFVFNGFEENTVIISDHKGNGLIFDPGCYTSYEEKELADYIKDQNITIKGLFNTHCHIDHVLGNQFVIETYQIPLRIHEQELIPLQSVKSYASLYGFDGYKTSPIPNASTFIKNNETIEIDGMKFKAFHTPGHSPGHVVFYFEEDGFVINGDVLFKGSFGRTDLPGGDFDTLKRSIFNVMFQLPNETCVFSGHGPTTTIKNEKEHNYILQL